MHPLPRYLRTGLERLADADKAAGMARYMKTNQFFHGVQTPERRKLLREALQKHPIASFEDYEQTIRALWQGESREEMYLAIDLALHAREYRTDAAWPLYESMLRTATNWDTVDPIAGNLLGMLLLENRAHEPEVAAWTKDPNMWVRRASILVHLKHKEATNTALLEQTLCTLMHEKEFFIRKAIGWALREYAKTDAAWVRRFVDAHAEGLSPLSKREALKHLGRGLCDP